MKLSRSVFLCCSLLVSAQAQEATPAFRLEKTIPLPNVRGRIDHLAADIAGQRLFVAALGNNTVEVVDLKSGKSIRSLSGFAEPQGVAYAPQLDRLFVANGQDGTCRIIDGKSFETIRSVQCGEDADNVRYDETARRIYVGYTSALAVLDPNSGAKVAEIRLAGHPESFRLETDGPRIFVNVPQARHIAVVDRLEAKVTETWRLKDAKSNFPLFLDEANHRLFAGCRNPARLLVFDSAASGGSLVTTIPICQDSDDLFFDPQKKLLYVSCGQGVIDLIKQAGPNDYNTIETIPTAEGARTSLFVPELKILCLAVPQRGSQSAEVRVYQTN